MADGKETVIFEKRWASSRKLWTVVASDDRGCVRDEDETSECVLSVERGARIRSLHESFCR